MSREPRRGDRRTSFGVRVITVLAAIAAMALAASAPASLAHARATPGLVVGRGAWIAGHTDFVGYYLAHTAGRWVKVFCVSPDRREPGEVALRTVSRVPATSGRVTALLAETLSAHGDARTATQAEAVSQALNTEIGHLAAVAWRARFLSERVGRLAAAYVAEARRAHGPYRLVVHLPTSPLPGQSAVGTVTLRAASRPVAGVVRLRHTANVETPTAVRVNRTGTGRFGYRTVGGGAVHITASARVVPTTVQMSRTDPATQLMVTWSPRPTVRAYATYQGSGPGFGHRYACSAACAGRPDVTLTACAPASRYPSRITFWLGRQTHRISFPAATARSCTSWTTAIADSTPVSGTWQYRTPDGWTRPLPAGGAFVVDCPGAPPVAVQLSYDCSAVLLSVSLGSHSGGALAPLRNTTPHPMVLLVSGAVRDRIELAPGSTAAVRDYRLDCGSHATVTVRGGVQRSSGGYHFGQPVEVTLP
jgi:hypothetical protein